MSPPSGFHRLGAALSGVPPRQFAEGVGAAPEEEGPLVVGAGVAGPPAGLLIGAAVGPLWPGAAAGIFAGGPVSSSWWHPASTGIVQAAATQSVNTRFIFFVNIFPSCSRVGATIIRLCACHVLARGGHPADR